MWGVCVGRVVESEGCVLGGYIVERRKEHGASVLYTESDEKLVGYETIVFVWREEEKKGEDGSQMPIQEVSLTHTTHTHTHLPSPPPHSPTLPPTTSQN